MTEFTEPLKSGAKLPLHPDGTTARTVIKYGEVIDSRDGHALTAGLHRNEIMMLRRGEQGGLSHLYRYAIWQEGQHLKIFHTRSRVVVAVECIDADAELQ
jgi:hypothetical protein